MGVGSEGPRRVFLRGAWTRVDVVYEASYAIIRHERRLRERHRAPSRGCWTGTRARGQATVPTPVTETSSMLHRLTHRASHTLQVGAAPSGVPWRPRGFGASGRRCAGRTGGSPASVLVWMRWRACVRGVSRGDVRAAVGTVGGKASQEDGDVLCVRAVQGLCSPREGGGVEMGEGPHAGA